MGKQETPKEYDGILLFETEHPLHSSGYYHNSAQALTRKDLDKAIKAFESFSNTEVSGG